jgi:hypothetical protein
MLCESSVLSVVSQSFLSHMGNGVTINLFLCNNLSKYIALVHVRLDVLKTYASTGLSTSHRRVLP